MLALATLVFAAAIATIVTPRRSDSPASLVAPAARVRMTPVVAIGAESAASTLRAEIIGGVEIVNVGIRAGELAKLRIRRRNIHGHIDFRLRTTQEEVAQGFFAAAAMVTANHGDSPDDNDGLVRSSKCFGGLLECLQKSLRISLIKNPRRGDDDHRKVFESRPYDVERGAAVGKSLGLDIRGGIAQ